MGTMFHFFKKDINNSPTNQVQQAMENVLLFCFSLFPLLSLYPQNF